MTEEQFIAMLERLLAEGHLTAEEATDLLMRYDAGEIPAEEFPRPPEDVGLVTEEEADLVLAMLLVYLGGSQAPTETRRIELATQLADEFAASAERISGSALRSWHDQATAAVRANMLAQATLAKGGLLTRAELAFVEDAYIGQAAYLQRFAEEAFVREQTGDPMSAEQAASRLTLYAGAGYALFYQFSEQSASAGYVFDYNAVDDGDTCPACTAAEDNGPYLAGEGPMPGDVCQGKGRCRCTRTRRYSPADYANLTKQAA